jgi:hypothetical protein
MTKLDDDIENEIMQINILEFMGETATSPRMITAVKKLDKLQERKITLPELLRIKKRKNINLDNTFDILNFI